MDVDTTACQKDHVKNVVGRNWQTQLHDNMGRDLLTQQPLEEPSGSAGGGNDGADVLYGDNKKWFAAYALCHFKYFVHKDGRLKNGGARSRNLRGDCSQPTRPALRLENTR